MKIKIQILTNDGNESGRTFYTSQAPTFIINTIYDKLLDMLVKETE